MGNVTISIEVPEEAQKAVLNDVVDDAEWLKGVYLGQAHRSEERLDIQAVKIAEDDAAVTTIKGSRAERVADFIAKPEYKARAEREQIAADALQAAKDAEEAAAAVR